MTRIRFTTGAGNVDEIRVNGPASLDPRFDFLKTDEELAAIENSRKTFVEAALRHILPKSVLAIVAEAKIVADVDSNEYDLDLVDMTRPIDMEV